MNTNTDNDNPNNGLVKIVRNTIIGNSVNIEDNVIRTPDNINNNYEIGTLNLHTQTQPSTSHNHNQTDIDQLQQALNSQLPQNNNFTSSPKPNSSYPQINSTDIIKGGLTDYMNNKDRPSNDIFRDLFHLPNNIRDVDSSTIINNTINIENLNIVENTNKTNELENMISLGYLGLGKQNLPYILELNPLLDRILNITVLDNIELSSIIENNHNSSSLSVPLLGNDSNLSRINLSTKNNFNINIKNIFVTSIRKVKSFVSLNNYNVDLSLSKPYKLGIEYYDVLLNNIDNIVNYINNDPRINLKTKDYLINLFDQLKIRVKSNRDIQNLFENILLNKNNVYNHHYVRLQLTINEYSKLKELSNDIYFSQRCRGKFLNDLLINLQSYSPHLNLNVYSLFEFYMINDLDFIIYKNKKIDELINPEFNNYFIMLNHKFHDLVIKYIQHGITEDEIFGLFQIFNNNFKTFIQSYDSYFFYIKNYLIVIFYKE